MHYSNCVRSLRSGSTNPSLNHWPTEFWGSPPLILPELLFIRTETQNQARGSGFPARLCHTPLPWQNSKRSKSLTVATPLNPPHSNQNTPTYPLKSSFRLVLTTTSSASITQPKNLTPIKKLTPAKYQSRREKGLCYYCNEHFQVGHKCKCQFILLIVEPEMPTPDLKPLLHLLLESDPPEPAPTPPPLTDPTQISLHTLMGRSIPQTLSLTGQIGENWVSISMHGGRTHNFIQD